MSWNTKNPFPSWTTLSNTHCHLRQAHLAHGTSWKSSQAVSHSTKSTANQIVIFPSAQQQTRTNVEVQNPPYLQIRARHDSRHTRRHPFSRIRFRAKSTSLDFFNAVSIYYQVAEKTCDRVQRAIYSRYRARLLTQHKESLSLRVDAFKLSVFVKFRAPHQHLQTGGILFCSIVLFPVYAFINRLCFLLCILSSPSAWKGSAPLRSFPVPLFSPLFPLCNPPPPIPADSALSAPPAFSDPFSLCPLPHTSFQSSSPIHQQFLSVLRSSPALMADQSNEQAPQAPNINIDGLFSQNCTMCKAHTFMINRLRSQITDMKEDHASDSRSKRKKLEKHKEEIKNLKDRCSHLEDIMEQLKIITQGSHAEASTKVSGARNEPNPDFSLTQKTPYEL